MLEYIIKNGRRYIPVRRRLSEDHPLFLADIEISDGIIEKPCFVRPSGLKLASMYKDGCIFINSDFDADRQSIIPGSFSIVIMLIEKSSIIQRSELEVPMTECLDFFTDFYSDCAFYIGRKS